MTDKNKLPKKDKPQKKKRAAKSKEKPKHTLDELVTSMRDKNTHSEIFESNSVEDEAFWLDDDSTN
jgi:hypothetical protein